MAELIKEIKIMAPGFARAFPTIASFSAIMLTVYTGKYEGLYLLGGLLLNECINDFLKNFVAKPLMKNNSVPILGIGKRPKGAKNTSIFLSENIEEQKKLSTSYGMPSGHSQNATFFSTYLILHILNGGGLQDSIGKMISIGLLILLALYVLASRVYLNCHTTQQVIVGGLIGSGLGGGYYTLVKKYLSM